MAVLARARSAGVTAGEPVTGSVRGHARLPVAERVGERLAEHLR